MERIPLTASPLGVAASHQPFDGSPKRAAEPAAYLVREDWSVSVSRSLSRFPLGPQNVRSGCYVPGVGFFVTPYYQSTSEFFNSTFAGSALTQKSFMAYCS